jgi:hypothetical protein
MSFTGDGVKIANFPVTTDQLAGCLDSTPSAALDTIAPGESMTVRWNITIPHTSDPGVRVAIQFPGEPMQILKDNVNVNDLNTTVTIPQTSANSAVLQWLWASQEDGGFYLACSDLNIAGGTTGGQQQQQPQQPPVIPDIPTQQPPVEVPRQQQGPVDVPQQPTNVPQEIPQQVPTPNNTPQVPPTQQAPDQAPPQQQAPQQPTQQGPARRCRPRVTAAPAQDPQTTPAPNPESAPVGESVSVTIY